MVAADRSAELRDALVAELRAQGKITTEAVEAAVRRVPREAFMPTGTDLVDAYGFDSAPVAKRDEHGRPMSTVSAPYIQAVMLEQAELRPGMRVLEIGSGGLNAAYVAEIVGSEGQVVSVDIDPEVIDRAAAMLDAAGYGGRVRVLVVDGERGVPDEGPFDAIIVTVGAWDVAPAWLEQLSPDGMLVLPLIMNNVTRVIGLRRDGDHLTSTSAEVAGFVPMQGDGSHADRVFLLPDSNGNNIRLSFDSGAPTDAGQLDGVLATDRIEVWSGVTTPNGMSFADLQLWFAWFLDGFCRINADPGTEVSKEKQLFPFGVVRGAGFAYMVLRPALEGAGAEFGARAYGPDAQLAGTAMVEQMRAWDRGGRHAEPRFGYWPTGSDRSQIPAGAVVMDKTHGVVTISWPTSN